MLAEYPVKTKNAYISAITRGPDGNLWLFLENTSYGCGREDYHFRSGDGVQGPDAGAF